MSNYHGPNQPLYGAYATEPDQHTISQLGPLSGSEAFAPTAFLAAEQPFIADASDRPAEAVRSRARQKYGNDHVKHRRTRSGCLTCRLRRVKCDEGRPACERCGKGNRECTYPEPRTHTKSRARQRKHAAPVTGDGDSSSLDSVAEEDEEDDAEGTLSSPQKSQSPQQTQRPPPSPHPQGPPKPKARRKSIKHESPTIRQRSQTAITDGSTTSYASTRTRSNSSITTATSQDDVSWAHLDSRVQHLLEFHRSMNHHHYFFKYDADEFLHVTLIQQALYYVPLLHAICCFAAYYEAISRSDSHIRDFLEYYDKSVTLLLGFLRSGQKHTTATLLTILQLATFEEYLGDWANLLGHHKAAHNILVELYSPTNIVDTEKRRKLLMWYSHFDLVASFLSSYAPTLGKEWFHAIHKYNTVQVEQRPDDIDLRIMVLQNKHKVLAMDMAMLFHQLAKKQMNVADFMAEQQQICEALRQERTALDPMLTNPEHLTQPFPDAPSPKSLIQPDIPGQLYTGPLWQMNFFILDSLSMEMMHKIQVAKMTGREPPPEVRQIALEICRIFGIIEHWKGSPPGAILSCHAALGIAALVLAHDEQHIMWFRRKFALIESQGYTYPPTLRHTMAELWNLPEIHHWWLPNGEGYPEIVRAVRAWTSERTPSPNVTDGKSDDVRDMKTLISKLTVSDVPSGQDARQE